MLLLLVLLLLLLLLLLKRSLQLAVDVAVRCGARMCDSPTVAPQLAAVSCTPGPRIEATVGWLALSSTSAVRNAGDAELAVSATMPCTCTYGHAHRKITHRQAAGER